MGSLKSFIKNVRKAKTIAEERTIVKKESAAIRSSFRETGLDQNTRRVNISKLLYLYIIGEKTHFGQVECIKLLTSLRFADKRLGYLATMLLLDENQEVLTLLTNSLDNDMQSPNHFTVGLALNCLGNIASQELARDLYQNVERLIGSSNPYTKKKACFVAAKLIEKVPDLHEFFIDKVPMLINDRTHGILLGAARLIQCLYSVSESCRPALVELIPKILAHLKRISSNGYIPEYDVLGVTDPFLQVQLLATLRLLITDQHCSHLVIEQFNDVLTQVASNIDVGKNSAHSVLYECIRTIFSIESDQSLRILGVNMLGKFLSIKDNNTRYVALDQLQVVINIEPDAVQRHRATIVSCLADGDISIRRRALELSFAILGEQNIRVIVREILEFLSNCQDNELKPYITSQLITASSKFAPNQKWLFDTIIRVLKLSENYVPSDIISIILALTMECDDLELKKYIVIELLSAANKDPSQFCLGLVTVWSLGEFGELVLNSNVEIFGKDEIITEKLILSLLNSLLNNSSFSIQETNSLTMYILTCAIKLSVKFKESACIESLRLIISSRVNDCNLEIQTRAVEYQELFVQNAEYKRGILAKMPPPRLKERAHLALNNGSRKIKEAHKSKLQKSTMSDTNDLLLDLMSDEPSSKMDDSSMANNNDLLSDIFGNSGLNSTAKTTDQHFKNNEILDLFPTPKPIVTSDSSENSIVGYSDTNMTVYFIPKSFTHDGLASIDVKIESKLKSQIIQKLQLLIAVPKSQKLSISATTGDVLSDSTPLRQSLKINGPPNSKIKLRVKVRYEIDGHPEEKVFDFSKFKDTL